jgi:hypothetical protein
MHVVSKSQRLILRCSGAGQPRLASNAPVRLRSRRVQPTRCAVPGPGSPPLDRGDRAVDELPAAELAGDDSAVSGVPESRDDSRAGQLAAVNQVLPAPVLILLADRQVVRDLSYWPPAATESRALRRNSGAYAFGTSASTGCSMTDHPTTRLRKTGAQSPWKLRDGSARCVSASRLSFPGPAVHGDRRDGPGRREASGHPAVKAAILIAVPTSVADLADLSRDYRADHVLAEQFGGRQQRSVGRPGQVDCPFRVAVRDFEV